MSPRSSEFLGLAHRRLKAARNNLRDDLPDAAVSSAYYAMLSAARAALSEREMSAKTHKGTWMQLAAASAEMGLPAELVREVAATKVPREQVDYDAVIPTTDEAARVLGLAERFVTEIERKFA